MSNVWEEIKKDAAVKGVIIKATVRAGRRYNVSEEKILSDIIIEFELDKAEANNYIQQVSEEEKKKAVAEIIKTARRFNIPEEAVISKIKKEYNYRKSRIWI